MYADYSSPPKGYTPYYDSPPISSHNADYSYYTPQYESPQVKRRGRTCSHSMPSETQYHTARKQKQPIYTYDSVDDAYHVPEHHTKKRSADQNSYFNQEQIYDEQAKRSRARRSSTTTRTPQKPTKPSYTKPPPKATEEDAARAGIPSGYSIENWDPTESPIVLLGSVFDANSLGKWIYDWTVYHHGPSTPMADIAGDLWLLLIKLAGKMKRAEKNVERIQSVDSQEMAEDFVENGNRMWQKLKQLLKEYSQYMWRAARRKRGKGASMAEECARRTQSSDSQGTVEEFLEGCHYGGLYTKPKTLLRSTEPSQPLWNEVSRTIRDARLHRFISPLHIPMAKVLPMMFAFCTPVSARPVDADVAISEHWKLGASKFDWDAILTPDTVLCLITLMLEVVCVVIVSYKARNEPCGTYGFFAILFGVVVILISDDSRIPMAVAGPTIAVGGYFCARYGLAQSRLDPVNGQRYASLMLLTGVFLDCAAAHAFGVDGLGKGGLVQWSLLTFWLSISLWPYLARLLDFSRNDLAL
jgi:hypothetical protein